MNRSLNQYQYLYFVLVLIAAANQTVFAGVRTVHHFTGPPEDGQSPAGGVLKHNSVLFGTTAAGGGSNFGTVYRVNLDGSGYELLHEFAFSDGTKPNRALTLGGSTLYGTTSDGSSSFGGTVYKINIDGNGFDVLHQFAEPSGSGLTCGPLLLDGSTLYGTTDLGGTNGTGTVFKLNIDGTGYQELHSFTGGANDGEYPLGGLALSGSTLYGTTFGGGDEDVGTIFKISTNGSGYEILHEFDGLDGDSPSAGLTLNGSVLYGTTSFGGTGSGTILKINTDGSGFELLHQFASDVGEPNFPEAALTLAGSILYGTSDGGSAGDGTVFRINVDGTGFALLHEFSGLDGMAPLDLTLDGSILYGTTALGGNAEGIFGLGTVFALSLVPGDYSADGVVNAADYGVWRTSFGSSAVVGDGNGDGLADAGDYVLWRKNVGFGSTPGGNGGAIPEPATCLLAAVVFLQISALERTIRQMPD